MNPTIRRNGKITNGAGRRNTFNMYIIYIRSIFPSHPELTQLISTGSEFDSHCILEINLTNRENSCALFVNCNGAVLSNYFLDIQKGS